MKVLLLKEVPKFGKGGDIKEAPAGYARNFLIPRGLAVLATPQAEVEWKLKEEKTRREAETDLRTAQEMASRLDGYELEITAKAGEDGKLYGGLGVQKIVDELKKRGFILTKKQIALKEPLKTLGEHQVVIKLEHGLEAEVLIIIKGTEINC